MARPRAPSPHQDKWGWAGDLDSRPLAATRPFMLGGSQRRGARVPGLERNRATGQLMPIVGLVTRPQTGLSTTQRRWWSLCRAQIPTSRRGATGTWARPTRPTYPRSRRYKFLQREGHHAISLISGFFVPLF